MKNKKIVAIVVLAFLLSALYLIIFWVCPLFFSNLCNPPILNVLVMHLVFGGVMAVLLTVGWAIKVVLK